MTNIADAFRGDETAEFLADAPLLNFLSFAHEAFAFHEVVNDDAGIEKNFHRLLVLSSSMLIWDGMLPFKERRMVSLLA